MPPLVTAARPPMSPRISNLASANNGARFAPEPETHQLIQACQEGDEAAWDALVRRYQPLLDRYAFSLCHNHAQADDIVGETLLHLYLHLSTFRQEANFLAWLLSIARHVHLDLCVRPKYNTYLSLDTGLTDRSQYPDGYDIPDPAPSPEAVCLQKVTEHECVREIDHLPAKQRQVWDLYYIHSQSYQEICRATGLPEGTVKSRLGRARHRLRERLERCA